MSLFYEVHMVDAWDHEDGNCDLVVEYKDAEWTLLDNDDYFEVCAGNVCSNSVVCNGKIEEFFKTIEIEESEIDEDGDQDIVEISEPRYVIGEVSKENWQDEFIKLLKDYKK